MLRPFSAKGPGISIALSAQDARTIPQPLLDSILAQERLPDEFVICVDELGPMGREKLQNFQDRAGFPVHIHRNGNKLGQAGSTLKALSLCKREVIVGADCWDLWLPDKLQTIEQAFLESPKTALILFNATLADGAGESLGGTVWEEALFDRQARYRFARDPLAAVLKHHICRVPCMAFRADHLRWILPVPLGWNVEGWIGLMLCALQPVTLMARPLSLRRLDGRPQPLRFREPFSKIDGMTQRWERRLHCWELAVDRLECLSPRGLESQSADKIRDFIQHYQFRASLPDAVLVRLKAMIPEFLAGRYHRFSYGWQCLFRDMFLLDPA